LIVQVGDIFAMGEHRIICGDATDPAVLDTLMGDTEQARLVLTDEPYNVPVAEHVTSEVYREFLKGSAMTEAEFQPLTLNGSGPASITFATAAC
jgi:hypothetical protein